MFFGDEHPILFLCKDVGENKYLCQCYEYRGIQKWHLTKISAQTLRELLDGRISVLDVYKQTDFPIHNITYTLEKEETDEIIKLEDIDILDLPDDMFLEEEDREDYIDFFTQRTNDISVEYQNLNLLTINSDVKWRTITANPFETAMNCTVSGTNPITYSVQGDELMVNISISLSYAA